MKGKSTQTRISWANTSDIEESDITIVGINDESGSHSVWSGTSKAPDAIRRLSNERDIYMEHKMRCVALPTYGLGNAKIYDYGNIKKRQIPKAYGEILSFPKIPIGIGGDHSNTTPILKELSKKYGRLSLVYFDAHPDFVSHTRGYYGSVITDSLDYIDTKSSLQIGIRSPESEELDNLKKHGIRTITPFEILESGVIETSKIIVDTIKDNVYVSFDMDCLDPSCAPGVSVPVPAGIQSLDATYLVKKIIAEGIVGIDIMEVCPPHDINDITAHLASRLIGEVISSCKV